tara:strand:- start:25 stop:213 length:189 start_codon:yes stop_codon:yes gene_type:complete
MHIEIARKISRLRDIWEELGIPDTKPPPETTSDHAVLCYILDRQIEIYELVTQSFKSAPQET